MPRTIKAEDFDVYRLDELEPDARQKAIEAIAAKLGGDWWDQDNVDDVSGVIIYTLAEKLGMPGYEEQAICGAEVPGVKLKGWDLERGSYLALRGTLTRENAPALPWADGVIEVNLHDHRTYTVISVETHEDDLDPDGELDLTVARERCRELAAAMERAVEGVIGDALEAGHTQMEYIGSEENAIEDIEANQREFEADGTPYFG